MAFLIGGANSAADTAFSVDNSCRFNDGDSASMLKAASTGDRRQFTLSAWVKRGVLGTEQQIWSFRETSSNVSGVFFDGSTDRLKYSDYHTGSTNASIVTNRVFRDCSAWYHIVCAVDTDQGTDTNRIKIYVNGTQETSFAETTYPSQNTDLYVNVSGENHYIGTEQSGRYADMYMAEIVFIDGTQNAVTDFGEFDEDSPTIWKPIDVSGLTFGTNGFYLDFEDSANLGNDANGGTDFTESNLAATDQASDSPTNNFSTMNPLDKKTGGTYTFAEGNLEVQQDISRGTLSTFAVAAGKWYAEAKFISTSGSDCVIGVIGFSNTANEDPGIPATGYVYNQDGTKKNSDTDASFGDSYTTGDIVGIALDLTNLKIYFAKNGTWQDSGDPTSGGTGTGAAYTITAPASTPSGFYFFTHADELSTNKVTWNFGNPPYANSSSVADGNGYGAFEYAPPSGYLALCTKNLGSDGG